MKYRLLMVAVFTLSLAACGGGGGSQKTSTPTPSSSSSSLSSVSSSSQANAVQPLPAESGTISFYFRQPYFISEETGVVTPTNGLLDEGYPFTDIAPDGTVIATQNYSTTVDAIDLLTGLSIKLFDSPEPLDSIAVSASGTIAAISYYAEFQKWKLYHFSANGDVLSKSDIAIQPG